MLMRERKKETERMPSSMLRRILIITAVLCPMDLPSMDCSPTLPIVESLKNLSEKDQLELFKLAVQEDNQTRMKQLVLQKSLNLGDDYSILHYLVSMHTTDYLRIYLTSNTKPELNPRTSTGETPLMLAFEEGNDEVIHLLLQQKGLDIHAVSELGWSTLMYAAKEASTETFKQFLAYPTSELLDVNHQNRNGLLIVDFLLQRELPSKKLTLFLEYAAGRLKIRNVKTLFETLHRTNPQSKFAVVWQHLMPMNQRNLIQGWNEMNRSVLCYSQYIHVVILKEWLKVPGIDVNVRCSNFMTPLMLFLNLGGETNARILLRHPNIQLNLQDKDGSTALMYASSLRGGEYKDLLEELLHHPDIDATLMNKEGYTGMDLAILKNNVVLLDIYQNILRSRFATWAEVSQACKTLPHEVLRHIATLLINDYAPNMPEKDRRPWAEGLVEKSCEYPPSQSSFND